MTDFLTLATVPVVSASAIASLRYSNLAARRGGRRTHELVVPRGLRADAVEAALRSLQGLQLPRGRRLVDAPHVLYEIVATDAAISLYLTTEAGATDYVLGQWRSALPGLRVTEVGTVGTVGTVAEAAAELALVGTDHLFAGGSPRTGVDGLVVGPPTASRGRDADRAVGDRSQQPHVHRLGLLDTGSTRFWGSPGCRPFS